MLANMDGGRKVSSEIVIMCQSCLNALGRATLDLLLQNSKYKFSYTSTKLLTEVQRLNTKEFFP